MLPYAGDALGKATKGSKLVARVAHARTVIADNAIKARQIIASALKSDSTAIRAGRVLKQAERLEEGLINGCKYTTNRFGTRSPVDGWVSGEKGNGLWDAAKRTDMVPDKLNEIMSITKGKPTKFNEGYPDFPEYSAKLKNADGKLVPGKVEIPMKGENTDFDAARSAMAEKLGVAKFKEPKGYTWHHHHDGTTMELIPSALHNNVPHTGGARLARDSGY